MTAELPSQPREPSRPAAWTWPKLLVAAIAVVLLAALVGRVWWFFQTAQEAAWRSQCRNKLKQIALALSNYHEAHGSFPPAYTVNERGERMHSWRSLILSQLDASPLASRMDFSKPWNDPINVEAMKIGQPAYCCPSAGLDAFHTTYQVVVGEGTCFPGSRSVKLGDIDDPHSLTLLVVEVPKEHAVNWMEPRDIDEALFLRLKEKGKLTHVAGINVACVDGTIRCVPITATDAERHAVLTISGGEKVDPFLVLPGESRR